MSTGGAHYPAKAPTRLYKYIESRYVDAMLSRGTIRVGTLFEFRDREKHGPRADPGENTFTNRSVLKRLDPESNDPSTAFERAVFRGAVGLPPGASRVEISNNLFERRTDGGDAYVYCLADRYTAEIAEKFKTDACVEIVEPRRFTRALYECLADKVDWCGLGYVVYNADASQGGRSNDTPRLD